MVDLRMTQLERLILLASYSAATAVALVQTAQNQQQQQQLSVSPTPPDIDFHNWCSKVGIAISPSVQLATTSQSVAGRGVFAIEPIEENEPIAFIPSACIFHSENAAECFPETAQHILEAKKANNAGFTTRRKKRKWILKLWSKIFRKEHGAGHYDNDVYADLWQPELTQYALSAKQQNHIWSDWISQWQRNDPVHRLILSGAASNDENAIKTTANELKETMPSLSHLKLQASLAIRLERIEKHKRIMNLDTTNMKTLEMYSLVISRAIELDADTGLTGIIPFFDMINHSVSTSVELHYEKEEDMFVLFVNRNIAAGEELFVSYTTNGEVMDENNAIWTLVQWGIPTDQKDICFDDNNVDIEKKGEQ